MPRQQRGSVRTLAKHNVQARYLDENGKRVNRNGFRTETAAWKWLDDRVREVEAIRRGETIAVRRTIPTFDQLADEYLDQHGGQDNTLHGLRAWLTSSRREWGDVRVDKITAADIARWRREQPERSAWHYHRAVKQVLGYGVRTKQLAENAAAHMPNPQPRVRDVPLFQPDQVEAIASEHAPIFQAIPIFAAYTGLRPEEWCALERADVDRQRRVVHVRRVYTDGVLKDTGKTAGSLRTVPLASRAVQALDDAPTRLDSMLLFPSRDGGYINLSNWRNLEWKPACRAAGVPYLRPYALRHSYASWSIAAGVDLYTLATLMGTSVQMIQKHYASLMPDSLDRARTALDAFTTNQQEGAANG
jgi:integrase